MYGASSCEPLQSRSPAGAGARRLIPGFRAVYFAIKSSDGISARRRLCRERRRVALAGLWVGNLNGIIAKILDDGYVVNWARNINGVVLSGYLLC